MRDILKLRTEFQKPTIITAETVRVYCKHATRLLISWPIENRKNSSSLHTVLSRQTVILCPSTSYKYRKGKLSCDIICERQQTERKTMRDARRATVASVNYLLQRNNYFNKSGKKKKSEESGESFDSKCSGISSFAFGKFFHASLFHTNAKV